jgi:hypothetical protein
VWVEKTADLRLISPYSLSLVQSASAILAHALSQNFKSADFVLHPETKRISDWKRSCVSRDIWPIKVAWCSVRIFNDDILSWLRQETVLNFHVQKQNGT